jgi:NADP-dependent 3-hydroxy acid dehydrogenase YdfG
MRIDASTRALVTGGSRGIGWALAGALDARGATVGLASRTADEALARRLSERAVALACDVGDAASVQAAVDEFATRAGGLDLVVANAGIAHYAPFLRQDVADIEQMTRINWLGTVYTVKAALPRLVDQGRGHLVIVSSGAGLRSFPWAAGYGATKAAQRMFASALRHELDGTGVSVTTVYPGEIETELHAHERDRLPDWRGVGDEADPAGLAAAVLAAVEADKRSVAYPRQVALLGLDGLAPRLTDLILRRLRGRSSAPRAD